MSESTHEEHKLPVAGATCFLRANCRAGFVHIIRLAEEALLRTNGAADDGGDVDGGAEGNGY